MHYPEHQTWSLFFCSGRGSAWLERLVRDQEVAGSNPVAPTISKSLLNKDLQHGRFGGRLHFLAAVIQMVIQNVRRKVQNHSFENPL
jgi:hypothetical protein